MHSKYDHKQTIESCRRAGASPRRALPVFACMVLTMLSTTALAAGKPPQMIRQHLLEHPDKSVSSINSVEPFHAAALDELIETTIWQVEYSVEDGDGESLVFMAVVDGEVLRIRRFDQSVERDNFLKLLPDDFRVESKEDAARLVSASLALHFGFPFSEPEKTAEEMRFEQRGNEYFFVDGERFGDATGYRIATDDAGRVTAYEYSWELPVAAPEDD